MIENILTEVGQNNHFNWQGHRPFAEWLVKELKPKVIVDLGVDFGYSSFCFSLPNIGNVYGIDCFEGDAWAGQRNTYDYVLEKQKELKLSNLHFIKGYFDDIVVDWKDTINILHIDGFHSYEAVKNDYEKWSPFLEENSVILFHDTMVDDPKFGVSKFFKELDLYKTNFGNSNGLGVASKNKNIINKIKMQFANNIFEITTNTTEKTLISILEQNPFITTDKNSVCYYQYKDKWMFLQYHSYIEGFYEEHFSEYRDKNNRILEIGIDTGGSITLWHNYFSNSTILGVDIKKDRLVSENDESKLNRAVYAYVKDAYDPVFVDTLGTFDIIIDDGPHTLDSQLKSIKYYLPKLNTDGILVIEDIASIEYAMDLYNSVPNDSNYEKILVDLREKDNRYDSIILAIKKKKLTYKDVQFYSFCFPNMPAKMRMSKQADLMLGAAVHNIYNPAYCHDDTGDNISSKNYWFGQTTGLYWVWKNSNEDFVGLSTYRLFWNQEELSHIEIDEDTLIIPKSVNVNSYVKHKDPEVIHTLMSHLTFCHGETPISLLYGLCKTDNIPITIEMIDDLKYQQRLHPFNMFVTSKKINNKICEILFDILFKFYDHYMYLFQTIESHTGQKRILDFLAERILHIIYKNIDQFIPGTTVHEVSVIDLPH